MHIFKYGINTRPHYMRNFNTWTLKGVDDLWESNILVVAGYLCEDRPVLVRFLL